LQLRGELLQSCIFLKLAVAGHLTIFLARTRGPFGTIRPSAMLFRFAQITKVLARLVAIFGW
jgi:H+-transporting ATPase